MTTANTRSARTLISLILILAMSMTMVFFMSAEPAMAASKKSAKKAVKTALENAGLKRSEVCSLKKKYSKKDKCCHIEFCRRADRVRYNYDVRISDGRIMERDISFPYRKTSSRKKIGREKAAKIVARRAKKKLSVVRAGSCTYRYKKHLGIYQLRFRSGSGVYEYELLAATGKIRETEYKYAGR